MKRRSFKLISVAGIALMAMFVLTQAAPAASYVYTKLDDPSGAVGTTNITRINDNGDIVGYYTDSNGTYHGFLYSGDTYTPINDPGAGTGQYQGTKLLGINDYGDIVGSYFDSSDNMDGFLCSGGVYTTIYGPKGISGMYATDIDDSEDIVGLYSPSGSSLSGFLDSNNTFAILDYPNATSTSAIGINDYEVIVGFYSDSSGTHGFVYSDGAYTKLDDPSGVGATYAIGINDSGDIVGYYTDSNGTEHGFLYSGNTYTYTRIDDPSAGTGQNQGTGSSSINNNGEIVGTYFDSSGGSHGFLANPQPLLQNAKSLGGDWYWSSWFGYFNTNSSPWIYHLQLGWLYPYDSSTDSIWFYDSSMNAFLWTSATVYPYFYRASDGAWLWYEKGTSKPCWFYNSNTGGWEKY